MNQVHPPENSTEAAKKELIIKGSYASAINNFATVFKVFRLKKSRR